MLLRYPDGLWWDLNLSKKQRRTVRSMYRKCRKRPLPRPWSRHACIIEAEESSWA